MKFKRTIMKVLIMMLTIIMCIGTTFSSAEVVEYLDSDTAPRLKLTNIRYSRQVDEGGNETWGVSTLPWYGYVIKRTGKEGEHDKPVWQIMNGTQTNYYCLNAAAGYSWQHAKRNPADDENISNPYNRIYTDLESDLESIKTNGNAVYENIAKSPYLNQILWILDNIYISDPEREDNQERKEALLASAGIVTGFVDADEIFEGYVYKNASEDARSKHTLENVELTPCRTEGYCYMQDDGNGDEECINVELPDEILEVAQQAALWYFTNGLKQDVNIGDENYGIVDNQLYNVYENSGLNGNGHKTLGLALGAYIYSDNSDAPELDNDLIDNLLNAPEEIKIGQMWEEQAAIVCHYLIQAANNYAASLNGEIEEKGSPLVINEETTDIEQVKVGDEDYYVLGPIKIDETREAVYELSNKITVNDDDTISTYVYTMENGTKVEKTLKECIGKEFYVRIPKIQDNNITLSFGGTYNKNTKKLWTSKDTGGYEEQPIVEVIPETGKIELEISATKVEKPFDLALRKEITAVKDSKGDEKLVLNEKEALATRTTPIDYSTDPLLNNETTATYPHRKDPVLVKKGDTVEYTLTIYNEGEADGYASKIVDQLPEGLTIKGATKGTVQTEISHADKIIEDDTFVPSIVTFNYEYDSSKNTITFTTDGGTLHAFKNVEGARLDNISIPIECEVTAEPSTTMNTYLTNVAYIAEAYNTEIDEVVEVDRDSATTDERSPLNKTLVTKGQQYNGYKGKNSNKSVYEGTNQDYYEGEEDDDDFEIVVLKPVQFDLALQKYITNVYSKGNTKPGRQAPVIDSSKLASGEATTATYTLDKTPVPVQSGDYVLYTLEVYNECEVAGYVNKITDNIPTGLQFVYQKPTDKTGKTLIACDSKGNMEEIEVDEETYKLVAENNACWSIDSVGEGKLFKDTYNGEETISVTCDVKSYLGDKYVPLNPYDSSKDKNNNGDGIDRTKVTVVLRVSAENKAGTIIRNEAAITEAQDTEGNIQDKDDLKDRDSQTNQWPGKDGDKKYQDDEDYDRIVLKRVDLALTKFITAVSKDMTIEDGEYLTEDTTSKNAGSKSNPYLRATRVDSKELRDNEDCHDATYIMVKDPLTVLQQSYVLYNIRLYNEGEVDVYVGEVKDYLPEYLDYVECEFNEKYGWEVGSDGKTITTTYLSYESEKANNLDNLLKAFDKENDDGEGSGLDYRDIQILCRVNDKAPTETKLINSAEITKYEDEDGDEFDKDIDSESENLEEKNTEVREEDDDDYEVVIIKKFDLSLLKYVTTVYVTEDGVTKTIQTGNVGDENDIIPKVEIHRKKIDSTIVKFGYTIKITNEGEIAGEAREITDYVPEGLKFYAEDNKGWTDEGNNVISTRLLEGTVLEPKESAEVTVILRWINGSSNLGLKTNVAEISEDFNKEGIPDCDSVPDNRKPGEDDIDDASVILSISTGLVSHIVMYASAATVILAVLGSGLLLIKKYVL